MKRPILKDFEKWKDLNMGKNFSFFDYIFHVTKQENVSSDIFFAFLELFWPSFVVYNKYVLLKSNLSEERIEDLINEKKDVEYWMNFFLISPYFESEESAEEKAELFAKSLAETWRAKLIQDFPNKKFVVECAADSECGDYGLTFYQQGKSKIPLTS